VIVGLFIAVLNIVALAAEWAPITGIPVAVVMFAGWTLSIDVIRNKIGAVQ
jgi:hypothetical protein